MEKHKLYAVSGVPFLLAFGVPALLVGCVVCGVWVLAVLIAKQVKEKKQDQPDTQL